MASRQLFINFREDGCGRTVDRGNRLRIQNKPTCRLRQTLHNPYNPIPYVINVEKDQAALDEIDSETRDCLGARLAMQLIEAIPPRDTAKQGIAGTRYARQKIDARGRDGDNYAPQNAKTDNAQHSDERE